MFETKKCAVSRPGKPDLADISAASPETFWEIADHIQERTLASATTLFRQLESANLETVKELLLQYRYFTVYYIPDLAMMVARMSDGYLRSFLADILYDELGRGNPAQAHPQLYDEFLYSIGFDREDLSSRALADNVSLLDEAREALIDPARSEAFAVGLRGMGGECVCQVYIAELYEWLCRNPHIKEISDQIDWRFWALHVGEHDIEHRETTRKLIDREIVQHGGEALADLGEGYRYSMESWEAFWANIFHRCGSAKQHHTTVHSSVNLKLTAAPVPTAA